MFLIFTEVFKIDFQNRKWNYPNTKWNYLNRKWNYFTYFQASDQKTVSLNVSHLFPRGSKLIFKTENGIIFPPSRPLLKNLFYKMFFHYFKGYKIYFQTGNGIIRIGKVIILPTYMILIKKNFYCFSFVPSVSKMISI